MSNKRFIQGYEADGAITKNHFVKPADADDEVSVVAASTDNVLGVSDVLTVADGEPVDVILTGAPDVKFGGTVARGGLVMANSSGQAVAYTQTQPVQKIIAGGAAGAHTVTGIKAADTLISVFEQDGTSGLLTDLTSEFSVTADDTIDNTGGTATTSDFLVVTYMPALQNVPVGRAKHSAVSGDIAPVILGLN